MGLNRGFAAAVLAAPALAVSVPGAAAQQADVAASAELAKMARAIGDATARERPGPDERVRLVLFGGSPGDPRVIGIQVAESLAAVTQIPPGTIAAVRGLSAMAGTDMPGPAERAFVERHGIPLFVMGEWIRLRMWEVGRRRGALAIREVEDDGAPGPWKPWPAPE